MLLARIIFVCVLVFDIGMSARLASGQNCYNSQAERNFELRSVQSYIRDLQSRPSSDGYTSIARNGGIDLQRLQNDERRISSTPICSPGTTGYAGSSSGYGHGIPPQEIARATVEIAEFAQRDAERAQREIEANRQYYSAERDRTQKEFAALHNDLESQLRGIEASERGGGARDRSRDPQEMQRQADARAQYYQQRQQLIDALVGKGLDSTAAESAVDNFGESVQRSAADAALDAAMQNPNSFTPGEAFRGYPASLGSPLEGGRGELPSGALPPTDPLDQYDSAA